MKKLLGEGLIRGPAREGGQGGSLAFEGWGDDGSTLFVYQSDMARNTALTLGTAQDK